MVDKNRNVLGFLAVTVVALITITISASVAHAQESAPTKVQCDADANLWVAGLETPESILALVHNPAISARELLTRSVEMDHCMFAYVPSKNKWANSPYGIVSSIYSRAYSHRVDAFLERHRDMWQQFVTEDAAGLR
jgi:hypothetical protein